MTRISSLVLYIVICMILNSGSLIKAEIPYPIVLIHGLNSGSEMWPDSGLVETFFSLGWENGGSYKFILGQHDTLNDVVIDLEEIQTWPGDIWLINFKSDFLHEDSNEASIFLQAKALQLAIRNISSWTGKEKVILLGHSMGGLAASAYLVYGDSNDPYGRTFNEVNQEEFGVSVAKFVTLGTPFGGALEANLLTFMFGLGGIYPDQFSNAFRDLSKDWPFHNNIFLFGGNETEVVPLVFESRDVNCNGTVSELDYLIGINNMALGDDWPTEVSYFNIIGNSHNWGDGVVDVDDQYLFFADTKVINAQHAHGVPGGGSCTEAESHDAIIEALDEPDYYSDAWEIKDDGTEYFGIISKAFLEGIDTDYFKFENSGPNISNVIFYNDTNTTIYIKILDQSGSMIPGTALTLGPYINGDFEFQQSSSQYCYLEVQGNATPSNPDVPCETTCSSCRLSYRFSIQNLGPAILHLNPDSTAVPLGNYVTISGTLTDSNLNPLPGNTISFHSSVAGSYYSGCTQVGLDCEAITNLNGQVQITFGTDSPGLVQILGTTENGGNDSIFVNFVENTIQAAANPTPINQASTFNVNVLRGDNTPPPAGTEVTFSTSFPGFFSGNGASSTSSPSTVQTDADGDTWIYFSSPAVGSGYMTIESIGTSIVVPFEVYNPNGDLNVNISVGFQTGSTNSSTYDIETLVTNQKGQTVSGERVDFTTTRGTLSVSHDFTGPTGIADANLTVNSSGNVTVTATAGGVQAATTFYAQVGDAPVAPMFPDRSFSFGNEVLGVAYSPDNTTLIAGDYSGNIKAWNTSNWSTKWTNTTSDNRASQISISPDGSKVLMANDSGVDIFNVSNGSIYCSVVNPDNKGINATFVSNSVFFDTSFTKLFRHGSLCSTGSQSYILSSGDFQREGHMDYSSSKGWLATTNGDGVLLVWNSSGGLVTQQQVVASQNAYDTKFKVDGSKLLVAGGSGGIVKAYSTSNWSANSFTAQNIGGTSYSVTYVDNENKIAVGGVGKVEVLSTVGGASFRVGSVSGHAREMAWSQSRNELAVGTSGGQLYIFKPLDPVDTQTPTISISNPIEGLQTNQNPITLSGRVTDDHTVSSFSINGTPVSLDGTGHFSHISNLIEGQNTITFSASDPTGNTSEATRHVTLFVDHIAPVISNVLITPSVGLSGTVFTLSADVQDGDSGVASVSVSVKNGVGTVVAGPANMTIQGDNAYSFPFDSGILPAGFYSIDLQAVDSSPQSNQRFLENARGFEIADCSVSPTVSLSGATQICPGEQADIQVYLAGRPPWSILWSDGVLQENINSSTPIRSVAPMSTTNYSVSMVNDHFCQGASSNTVTVLVREPVSNVQDPVEQIVCPGDYAELSVSSSGTFPFSYAWHKNGAIIPGAEQRTLVLPTVTLDDDGFYYCVITNPCGSHQTHAAHLSVNGVLRARISAPAIPQGLTPLSVGFDAFCTVGTLTWDWENMTTNQIFGPNENPVLIDPMPTEITVYRLTVTDDYDMETTEEFFSVLVNPSGVDLDGDGQNAFYDLLLAIEQWPDGDLFFDADGDGRVSILDFQYINTGDHPIPSVNSFTATPTVVSQGQSSTLEWDCSDTDEVRILGNSTSFAPQDSLVVTPLQTNQYTIKAIGSGGTSYSNLVIQVGSAPIINCFEIDPSTVLQGANATLSWAVDNADSVSIDQGIGSVQASGTQTVSPNQTTNYTLQAVNGHGTSSQSVLLTVTQPVETISKPNLPIGSSTGTINSPFSYSTTGSASNLGHQIEYEFDWYDGIFSNWNSTGLSSHSWQSTGSFSVRAHARCVQHPSIISGWSDPLNVEITEVPQNSGNGEIFLTGGNLNGQNLSNAVWGIDVGLGETIVGTIGCQTSNIMSSGAVAPFGYTWTWGARQTDIIEINHDIAPGVSNWTVPINLTAPDSPGTYYLLFGFNGEFNMQQVMSCDNWNAGGSNVWNDGNDYHDLSEQDILFANQNGFVDSWTYRFISGYNTSYDIPVMPIKIEVIEVPDVSGSIIFESNKNGDFDLYTINPDGSNVQGLLIEVGNQRIPRLSPDGLKIRYWEDTSGYWILRELDLASGTKSDIWTPPANGLVDHDWRNDSTTTILYWPGDCIEDLYEVDQSGNFSLIYSESGRQLLWGEDWSSGKIYFGSDPCWSPSTVIKVYDHGSVGVVRGNIDRASQQGNVSEDGLWLTYRMTDSGYSLPNRIHVISTTGNSEVKVSSDLSDTTDSGPDFDPSGNRIVFVRSIISETGHSSLYIVNRDGAEETVLRDDGNTNTNPCWGVLNADFRTQ